MIAWRVLRSVFSNRDLRRVELAFLGFNSAEWGSWIAVLVYAYEHGGATTAGLVALAQLVPAGIFAPFASVLSDRRGPARVLFWGYIALAVSMAGVAAALLLSAPPLLVYALAAVAATMITIARPAQSAVVPGLAHTADELTATNVASGWIESLSVLVAPALTGLILAISTPGMVFVVTALFAVAAALLVAPVQGPAGGAATAEAPFDDVLAGFRLVARQKEPRLLVGLLGAQFIGIGALDVLYVVLALGLLHMGESGAGYLNAAFGAGGALSIGLTVGLIGRKRLAPPLLAGIALWFAALWLFAAYPTTFLALVLLAGAGAGRTMVDVAGRTLLQRTAPTEILSRVFGVLEGLSSVGLAIGSLLTPLLVAIAGAKAALVGVGAILPLIAVVAGRSLLRIDRNATVPVVEISLLRSVPMFSPLGAPELERLARGLKPVEAKSGTVLMREGEPGNVAYLIAEGELEVTVGGKPLALLGRGDIVGEIALLRGGQRVATVTAQTDAKLYELDREVFLESVAGSRAAAGAMDQLIDRRLAEIEELGVGG